MAFSEQFLAHLRNRLEAAEARALVANARANDNRKGKGMGRGAQWATLWDDNTTAQRTHTSPGTGKCVCAWWGSAGVAIAWDA